MKKKLLKDILYPILALLLFIAIWAIIAAAENHPLIFPQVNVIFDSFFSLLGTKEAWTAVLGTFTHVISAFLIAFVTALFLSILTTIVPTLHKIIGPFNSILRSVPTIIIIYIGIFWITYKDIPMFIGFLIAYPLLYSFFRNTFVNVDSRLLDMSKTFNVSKVNQIRYVYLPNVLPSIFDSCSSVISLTVKVVIAAEILANVRDTIGAQIQISNSGIEIESMLAFTLLAIILSFILEVIFLGFKKLAEVKYGY